MLKGTVVFELMFSLVFFSLLCLVIFQFSSSQFPTCVPSFWFDSIFVFFFSPSCALFYVLSVLSSRLSERFCFVYLEYVYLEVSAGSFLWIMFICGNKIDGHDRDTGKGYRDQLATEVKGYDYLLFIFYSSLFSFSTL